MSYPRAPVRSADLAFAFCIHRGTGDGERLHGPLTIKSSGCARTSTNSEPRLKTRDAALITTSSRHLCAQKVRAHSLRALAHEKASGQLALRASNAVSDPATLTVDGDVKGSVTFNNAVGGFKMHVHGTCSKPVAFKNSVSGSEVTGAGCGTATAPWEHAW